MMSENTRCGFVAIVGRPNVGKSSLLNMILGKKVSITSFRPQTTRQQILGIYTENNAQTIYVDTPGFQLGAKSVFNQQMNKAAKQALQDVDVVIFVVEALKWTDEDNAVLQLIQGLTCPIILAINKIDLLEDKTKLLSYIENISRKIPRAEIVPLSALDQIQTHLISEKVGMHLPPSPFYFPADQSTNRPEVFMMAELIREKLMILLDAELPYSVCVEIEKVEQSEKIVHIHALIWTEREGQKRIIIGEKGSKLKQIGTRARKDLEHYLKKKVYLKLWVKVKAWSSSVIELKNLGLLE